METNRLLLLDPHELRSLIHSIPRIELHCHLEALGKDINSLCKLAESLHFKTTHGINLPFDQPDKLRALIQVGTSDKSLLDFLKKFDVLAEFFVSPEVIEILSAYVVKELALDNVIYSELRFSPAYMARRHNLDMDQIVEAVVKGVTSASTEVDMQTGLILIVDRGLGIQHGREILNLAERWQKQGVVGIDLAADEANFPPHPFASIFQEAKSRGLNVTVHAGEAGPAENVRIAIEELQADRIGHGVRSFEDPSVEQLILQRGITLELCPTSNVQTGATPSLKQHPLRRYFDLGIKTTINTDDPGVCGTNLTDEFVQAVSQFNFSLDELAKLTFNAVNAAFIGELKKSTLSKKVTRGFDQARKYLESYQ